MKKWVGLVSILVGFSVAQASECERLLTIGIDTLTLGEPELRAIVDQEQPHNPLTLKAMPPESRIFSRAFERAIGDLDDEAWARVQSLAQQALASRAEMIEEQQVQNLRVMLRPLDPQLEFSTYLAKELGTRHGDSVKLNNTRDGRWFFSYGKYEIELKTKDIQFTDLVELPGDTFGLIANDQAWRIQLPSGNLESIPLAQALERHRLRKEINVEEKLWDLVEKSDVTQYGTLSRRRTMSGHQFTARTLGHDSGAMIAVKLGEEFHKFSVASQPTNFVFHEDSHGQVLMGMIAKDSHKVSAIRVSPQPNEVRTASATLRFGELAWIEMADGRSLLLGLTQVGVAVFDLTASGVPLETMTFSERLFHNHHIIIRQLADQTVHAVVYNHHERPVYFEIVGRP